MKKSHRTLLFWILAALFCIGTPIVVLMSQGYAFDWKHYQWVQTGAIFLKSRPSATVIRIGNIVQRVKPAAEILYTGTLFQSLIPTPYFVEVAAPNTTTFLWQKTLPVQPLTVTKATRIAIPYSQPRTDAVQLSTTTINFVQPRDAQSFAWSSDLKTLFIYDQTNATSQRAIDLSEMASSSISDKIRSALFSKDKDTLLVRTNETVLIKTKTEIINGKSYFADFLRQTGLMLSSIRFRWHANQNNILILMTSQGGYAFDFQTQRYTHFTEKPIIEISETKTGNYFLDENGIIYSFDPSKQLSEKRIAILPIAHPGQYAWSLYELDNNRLVAFAKNGPLSVLDTINGSSLRITNSALDVAITANETKMAYATGSNLYVYFLEQMYDDVKYEQGQSFYIAPLTQQAYKIFFANDDWSVIALFAKTIVLAEIDSRQPANHWTIPTDISFPLTCGNSSCSWVQTGRLVRAVLFP